MGQGSAAEAPYSTESLPRLDERVRDLLSEFPGAVAFQGLRRTLGVHPESLTRALRRLEREGAIERTNEGYRLIEPATGATKVPHHGSSHLSQRAPWVHPAAPRWEGAPRVELRLSPGEDAARVLGTLAGRWFGEYRWVGSYEEGERTTLLWVSRQGKELLGLVLERGHLRIHQQSPPTETEKERPFAAYELLQHVLSALREPRAPPSPLPAALPFVLATPRASGTLPRAG